MNSSSNQKIRVRFAPSPTGTLHVGGARTALFNFLFARHHGGTFILRIDDTDTVRNSETALQQQLDDLCWLGLAWDEGITPDAQSETGQYGPYRQSQRRTLYQNYLEELLNQNLAYYCFLSESDIEQHKAECKAAGQPYRPTSPDRNQPLEKALDRIQQGAPAVIRFKAPETPKSYTLDDLVRGHVTFSTEQAGDFVIARTDGMPMYNFCCVIDDALMEISHVFRGEEHLTNTLRQLMLFDALDFTPPCYAHASIILGSHGKKLSKRDGAVSCDGYRQQGYLPEALLNYMALLGWNDGTEQELYKMDELIAAFSAEQLNTTSPIFDFQKLTWLNSQHLRQLSAEQLWAKLHPILPDLSPPVSQDVAAWNLRFTTAVKPNINTLHDAIPLYQALCQTDLDFDDEALEVLKWPDTHVVLMRWIEALETASELNAEHFKATLQTIQTQHAIKGKALFMPLRVAMIGCAHGTELKILIDLLPKSILLGRAQVCLTRCTT